MNAHKGNYSTVLNGKNSTFVSCIEKSMTGVVIVSNFLRDSTLILLYYHMVSLIMFSLRRAAELLYSIETPVDYKQMLTVPERQVMDIYS